MCLGTVTGTGSAEPRICLPAPPPPPASCSAAASRSQAGRPAGWQPPAHQQSGAQGVGAEAASSPRPHTSLAVHPHASLTFLPPCRPAQGGTSLVEAEGRGRPGEAAGLGRPCQCQVGAGAASSACDWVEAREPGGTGGCVLRSRISCFQCHWPAACLWFVGDERVQGWGRISGLLGCAVQCGSVAMWSCRGLN